MTRIEWQLDGFNLPRDLIAPAFNSIAQLLQAKWELHFSDSIPRIAIFVSKQEHCLLGASQMCKNIICHCFTSFAMTITILIVQNWDAPCLLDLLWRYRAKEFVAEIPLIISNHPNLKEITQQFNIDFHHIPITKTTKIEQEKKQLELVDKYNIDLIILAKYMQTLRNDSVSQIPQIINIHHSFLPAFIGANPYHKAYERGVKIIGATPHYVTANLDAGPIIEQDVVKISHRDNVVDLIRKGKDLERIVLARAVRLHLKNRVLVYGNRTVVFE